jgi:hypothetical protein
MLLVMELPMELGLGVSTAANGGNFSARGKISFVGLI